MQQRTSGSQDPALFEDSPAVQAAVLEERRFNNLEGKIDKTDIKIDQVIEALAQLNEKVAIANGRTTKNELAIETLRDEQATAKNQLKDRRLWERLDVIEIWRTARDRAEAHQDGVQEGTVALRTSDKFWFATFMSLMTLILGVVIKFL